MTSEVVAPIPRLSALRWRLILGTAVLGTVFAGLGIALHISAEGDGHPIVVIAPGDQGPWTDILEADFPDQVLPAGDGHDGQQFYVIARNPWNLDDLEPVLSRPTYRLGRPLLPVLAWALHPAGGGTGLLWSLIAIELLGVFILGTASGAMLEHIGRPAPLALPLMLSPGVWATLTITGADVLATGLLVATLVALLRRNLLLALGMGAAAALAKESSLLPIAFALLAAGEFGSDPRRWLATSSRRVSAAVGAATALPAVAWASWTRIRLSAETELVEFGPPFAGLRDSYDVLWSEGTNLLAAMLYVVTVGVAIAGLIGTRTRPETRQMRWATAALLVLTPFLTVDVIGLDFNGPRTLLPLLTLGLLLLASTDRWRSIASASRGPDSDADLFELST